MLQKENIKKFSIVFFLFIFFSTSIEARKYLIIQSTTSTKNSGLLDVIEEVFEKEFEIDIRFVSAGTGQAIINARNGNGDLILVHSLEDEIKFVNEGYGVERHEIMYNDFVIIGPSSDPAGIGRAASVGRAFMKIADTKSIFVSRGDESGTHKKEMYLWELTDQGLTEVIQRPWYLESGAGMGATLNIAINKQAYTLSDRGTWIRFGNKGDFEVLFEGGEELFNPYGLILVNPKMHPHVNAVEGQTLIDWLIGEEGQQRINSYRIKGKQLFFANAK